MNHANVEMIMHMPIFAISDRIATVYHNIDTIVVTNYKVQSKQYGKVRKSVI